jgi:hypothetical protein
MKWASVGYLGPPTLAISTSAARTALTKDPRKALNSSEFEDASPAEILYRRSAYYLTESLGKSPLKTPILEAKVEQENRAASRFELHESGRGRSVY